jgi:hypothetical protein
MKNKKANVALLMAVHSSEKDLPVNVLARGGCEVHGQEMFVGSHFGR